MLLYKGGKYIIFIIYVFLLLILTCTSICDFIFQLRTQALASLHSGLQNNQGIPVAHVAQWLGMEVTCLLLEKPIIVHILGTEVLFHVQDEGIEDLLDYHGFSIKEFGEPYMVKEGPFLNNNDSGTLKCSKLVYQKKSRTMFEDVWSASLMEPVSSKAVKMIDPIFPCPSKARKTLIDQVLIY